MEGRHWFEHLTVEENLLTGAYTRPNNKEVKDDLGNEIEFKELNYHAIDKLIKGKSVKLLDLEKYPDI